MRARRLACKAIKQSIGEEGNNYLIGVDPNDPYLQVLKIKEMYGHSSHEEKAMAVGSYISRSVNEEACLRDFVEKMNSDLTTLVRLGCVLPDDFKYSMMVTKVKHMPRALAVLNALDVRTYNGRRPVDPSYEELCVRLRAAGSPVVKGTSGAAQVRPAITGPRRGGGKYRWNRRGSGQGRRAREALPAYPLTSHLPIYLPVCLYIGMHL